MKLTRRESLLAAVAGAVNPAPAAPTVEFGPARVSRLIAGGNPVSGRTASAISPVTTGSQTTRARQPVIRSEPPVIARAPA